MQLLLSLLPLVAFYLVESRIGLGPGILASLVATLPALLWSWHTRRRLDRLTLFAVGLAVALGGLAWLAQDERFVLWTPTAGSWLMAVGLGGLTLAGKDPIPAAMREADPSLTLSPDEVRWLRGVGWRLTVVLSTQGGWSAWAAGQSRETWLFVTGLGGWLVLGAWIAFEALWAHWGPAPPADPP